MAAKRTRSDSATAQVRSLENAIQDSISPPDCAYLGKEALEFWHKNIRSKALDSWTQADLLAAVGLANNQYYLTLLDEELHQQFRGKKAARDHEKIDSLLKKITLLQRTILAQRRDLQIHSHATNGESRDQRKRNANDAQARHIVAGLTGENDSSLIAFPAH